MSWDELKKAADEKQQQAELFIEYQQAKKLWEDKWTEFNKAVAPAIQSKLQQAVNDFKQFFANEKVPVQDLHSKLLAMYKNTEVSIKIQTETTLGLYLRVDGKHKNAIVVEVTPAKEFYNKHKQKPWDVNVTAEDAIEEISEQIAIMKHNLNIAQESLLDYKNANLVYQDVYNVHLEYEVFEQVINRLFA